jgi:hypothetical protein
MFNNYKYNVASIYQITMVEHSQLDESLNIIGPQIIIPFAPDQATLKLAIITSERGVSIDYSFTANIPRVQYAIRIMAEIAYSRYVFFLTDNNGTEYIIGKKNKGYRITMDGEISPDINNLVFKFDVRTSEIFDIKET